MRPFVILIAAAGLSPATFAANKEMLELQRDVSQLQDQVRTMNDKLTQLGAQLTTLVQQAVDNSRQASISVASMQNNFADTIKRQQDAVVGPVAAVGAKLDQMTDESRAVRENVADMASRLNRLDAKITDLQHMIDVLKNPPAPPPPAATSTATTTPVAPTGPPAGMQAESTYTNAYRDYVGGNYDLAMQEFTDYLKYFGSTTFAPNAQYYIGDIFYRRKDYDNSVIAFDAVLEHYQDNPKTPDAHLMKGQALIALNKRDAAAREFREIIAKFPTSEAAPKAKQKLKELGLSTPSSSAPAKSKSRRR